MTPNARYDLCVLAALPLILATAPLLLELFALTLAAMLPALGREQRRPTFPALKRLVILVPSHNEELNIGHCVRSLAASAGSTEDILVIAHNCTDRTAADARAAGAMVSELTNPDLRGKGNALEHGFHLAFEELHADAVMIIDADSTVSANLVTLVRERLQSESVLQCRYECQHDSADAKLRLRAVAFFCMNVVRPMGRKHLRLSSGIFGNGFAFRREVIQRVPYTAHSVVEDLEFHLALVSAGVRCDFVEEARVWAKVPPSGLGAATQTARWEGGRLRMFRCHGASLLTQVLRGRISLLEPLLDLASLPLTMEVLGLCLLLLFPVPVLRLYALCGFAILAFHLFFAIFTGPDPSGDLRALAEVPFYVVSKICMLPATFSTARNRAAWIRTSRTKIPK